MKRSIVFGSAALAALACLTNLPARAAASENTDDRTTTQMIVTVQSKHHDQSAPSVEKQDIAVYENGHKANVVSLSALKGQDATMQLFVVLDSSSRTNAVGTHIAELQNFMRSLPPTASVAIGYMTNGRVQVAESFTTDHEAAAKAMSLPGGSVGSNASPYFALTDLAKHWPAAPAANERRVVLWLTDGIDPYDTSIDMSNDIYLQASVADAQRASIQVSSIYLSGKGGIDRSIYGVNQGQSKLSIVAEQTGGVAYNQGFNTPVSLIPYLDDFKQQLDNQYRVVFESTNDGTKAALEDVRVKTEVAGVKLTSAARVYVRPAFKAD